MHDIEEVSLCIVSLHCALCIQSEGYFAHPLEVETFTLKLGNQIRGKLTKEFCANANFRLHEPHFPSPKKQMPCCRKSGLIKETMRLLSETLYVLRYVVFR